MKKKNSKGCLACTCEQELSGIPTVKCPVCAYRILEQAFIDIHWMARRYAHNRRSYAPEMFNRAIQTAVELGLKLKEDTTIKPATIYARDGQFGWSIMTGIKNDPDSKSSQSEGF